MAFLRRGLVTNRGEIPSIHSRARIGYESQNQNPVPAVRVKPSRKFTQPTEDNQPLGVIRKVERIIRMAPTEKEFHFVELTCGHRVLSRSTYQAFCKHCK